MSSKPVNEHGDIAVLLVDDDEPSVILTAKMLKRAGFDHVDTASNAATALSMLKNKAYGLVISDWNMPEMDGLQLLKTIRTDERLSRTPVLLMSIDDASERVTGAALAGANAFLAKPFDRPTLKAKLAQAL